jgi:outer membrane protein assembly factor BamE (lipoprotein component of BamABCDE complex)
MVSCATQSTSSGWTREEKQAYVQHVVENKWALMETGMTKAEVRKLLSSPSSIQYSPDRETWIYRYDRALSGNVYISKKTGKVSSFNGPTFY